MLPAREVLRERGNGRGRPGSPCGPVASLPAARSPWDPLASPEAFLAPSEGPPLRATLSLGEFSTAQACGAAGVGGTAIPPYSLGEPTRRPRGLGGGARPSPRSATFRGGGGRWGQCSASAGGASRAASGGPPPPAAPPHFPARRGARGLVSAALPAPAPGAAAVSGRCRLPTRLKGGVRPLSGGSEDCPQSGQDQV